MELNTLSEDDVGDLEDSGQSLIIPITSLSDKSLFIEIFPEEIKETNVTILMKVLQDEQADKSVWADAALLYMQRNLARESLTILEQACNLEEVIPDGSQKDAAKIRILAATGIAHLAVEQSGSSNNRQRQSEKDERRQRADQKFTQAGKIAVRNIVAEYW